MGILDKMLNFAQLDDEDDDDLYYDDEYDEEDEEVSEKKHSFFKKSDSSEDEAPKERPARSVITPMRSGKKGSNSGMEVCVIKPTSFDDAREIAETLLADRTVILNMEGLDLGMAQRIIDFVSGSCYSIDGNLQKVSNYIFLVTPKNVSLSGDMSAIMDAFDFSGIQTSTF